MIKAAATPQIASLLLVAYPVFGIVPVIVLEKEESATQYSSMMDEPTREFKPVQRSTSSLFNADIPEEDDDVEDEYEDEYEDEAEADAEDEAEEAPAEEEPASGAFESRRDDAGRRF